MRAISDGVVIVEDDGGVFEVPEHALHGALAGWGEFIAHRGEADVSQSDAVRIISSTDL